MAPLEVDHHGLARQAVDFRVDGHGAGHGGGGEGLQGDKVEAVANVVVLESLDNLIRVARSKKSNSAQLDNFHRQIPPNPKMSNFLLHFWMFQGGFTFQKNMCQHFFQKYCIFLSIF